MEYDIEVASFKPMMSKADQLNQNDPVFPGRPGCFHKSFPVELKAGVAYQIDLNGPFNPFLYVTDDKGTVLNADDNSGGALNARIVFSPTKSGTYKIIVTTSAPGATGQFNLNVSNTPGVNVPSSKLPVPNDVVPLPVPAPKFDLPKIKPGPPPGGKIKLGDGAKAGIGLPLDPAQAAVDADGRPIVVPLPVVQPKKD
jgi:hypothetical protein